MTYTPTPTESKQDKALVNFLEAIQKNGCLAGQASVCSISGGSRSKRTTSARPRQRREAAEQIDESETESDGSSPSPSQQRSKKPTPIKKKAARDCEKEEEWMQYINIARVMVISGAVGAGAVAMTGIFSGYSDAMMETLGYGSISRACGEGNYLINYGASRVIPGMKSCAEVTKLQQGVIAKAWGGIVALGGAFKITLPQNFSATPGALIDGMAKMLCRFFKERQLHDELMQKIAARNSGISQADIDRAVAQALAAQQAQVQAQQSRRRTRSRSRSRSRSPPGRGQAAVEQRSPTPEQISTPLEPSTGRRGAPPASAPVQGSRNTRTSRRRTQSATNTPESGNESDDAGKPKTIKKSKNKKSKKRSPPKKHRRSKRGRRKSKGKGSKKTKGKPHKKSRGTQRKRR